MATKKKAAPSDKPKAKKLPLPQVLAAIDFKQRDFYANLPDEDKKGIAPYVLQRFASTVQGDVDLQAYWLMAINSRVNVGLFELNKHPDLQWKLLTSCSPGMGKQYHPWVPLPKADTENNRVIKFLATIYPASKHSDLRMIAELNSVDELKLLAEQQGYNKSEIKEIFK